MSSEQDIPSLLPSSGSGEVFRNEVERRLFGATLIKSDDGKRLFRIRFDSNDGCLCVEEKKSSKWVLSRLRMSDE